MRDVEQHTLYRAVRLVHDTNQPFGSNCVESIAEFKKHVRIWTMFRILASRFCDECQVHYNCVGRFDFL